MRPAFTFVDLFAGLGGFHIAARRFGGQCVFAAEINETLRELYKKNFNLEPAGDICEVDTSDVPDHDVLFAGFPCQPFSKAGSQMGWEDAVRGTVFWQIVEILKARKPKLILLENVAHFVRHDSGNTYSKVEAALLANGYKVKCKQFSPHQFRIPQIRERIYMVAVRGEFSNFEWPEAETTAGEVSIKNILDVRPPDATPLSRRIIECVQVWQRFLEAIPEPHKLPSFPIWSMEFGATYPTNFDSLSRVPLDALRASKGSFGKSLKDLKRQEIYNLVPSHARGSSGVFPSWKQTFIRQNREFFALHRTALKPWLKTVQVFPSSLQKLEWNCQGEPRQIWNYVLQFRASGVRVKRTNTAPSLVAMTSTQVPIVGWERRYMTPRECARLQSMGSLKHLPIGDQAVRALGNAVNVSVVERILKSALPLLGNFSSKVTRVRESMAA